MKCPPAIWTSRLWMVRASGEIQTIKTSSFLQIESCIEPNCFTCLVTIRFPFISGRFAFWEIGAKELLHRSSALPRALLKSHSRCRKESEPNTVCCLPGPEKNTRMDLTSPFEISTQMSFPTQMAMSDLVSRAVAGQGKRSITVCSALDLELSVRLVALLK